MNVTVDEALVRRLLIAQFPEWADLPISRVPIDGWDNRNFRLGETLRVRLPSAACYVDQIEREYLHLPRLAPLLPLAVPNPVALGVPGEGYPWNWSIYQWIDGEIAARAQLADPIRFAASVAQFLRSFQQIDVLQGPLPGPQNFFRGGPLTVYEAEARQAIHRLRGSDDKKAALNIWETAVSSAWEGPAVWVHGDMTPANLLVRNGELVAVIDFGQMAIGDPACDLAIAWTFRDPAVRSTFRSAMAVDSGTWARGRGWALWKSAMLATGMTDSNTVEMAQCRETLNSVLEERFS